MNFMAYGISLLGLCESEVARILKASGARWLCDASEPAAWGETPAPALQSSEERVRFGEAGRRFARGSFAPARIAKRFEGALATVERACSCL